MRVLRQSYLLRTLSAVMILFGLEHSLRGQETRGQILGRVVDPSGAAIGNAVVSVLNTVTGVTTPTKSSPTGDFVVPLLISGTYTLSVEAPGFKKYIREGILLQIDDRVSVDVELSVGTTSESVKVTGDPPLLQFASSSSSSVVDNKRIMELPLKDGNPVLLTTLAPGVQNLTSGGMGRSRAFDNSSISTIGVNGVASLSNDFTLDGAPNTQRNRIAFAPPAELTQEFRMESASFDASQGFTPGAIVNVVLKSGGNGFHGSGYYFGQNTVFNANTFFNNAQGQPKTPAYLHRFGVNGSGPVIIPKLYNGQNRTFWTYGTEFLRDWTPETPYSSAVPTEEQKSGNFSRLLSLGSNYQIYDPATTTPAGNGEFRRLPFAGNIIPASRISPISQQIASLWTPPTRTGSADGSDNYYDGGAVKDNFYTDIFRIDHNFSEKHRLFFRGSLNKLRQLAYVRFNDATGSDFYRWNRGLALDDVYMLKPTMLLNVRYSFTRFREANIPLSADIDPAALGFSSQYVQLLNGIDPRARKLPDIEVTGYGSISPDTSTDFQTGIHSFASSLSHIVGAHNMKYGGELRIYQQNTYDFGQSAGLLTFDTDWTRGPLSTSAGAPMGQSLASFLLGLPTGGSMDVNDSSAAQSRNLGLYFHDDWRVSSKLTVNIGVRYEIETPITERYNRSVRGFDPTAALPIAGQVMANYAASPIPQVPVNAFQVQGGLNFAGVNGQPRTLMGYDKNNIMPRFGFAYTLNQKTVIRAGYGIFFDQLGLTRLNVNQAGYNRSTSLVASVDNGQTYSASIGNPFPNGVLPPYGSSQGPMTFAGQSITYFNPTLVSPYMQRWQWSIQRQLPSQTVFEAAYVGNRATKVRITRDLDAVPEQYFSTSPVRDQNAITLQTGAVTNPFYPLLPGTSLAGQTVARSQLLRPYPQFTGVNTNVNQGYSWYHALQVRLEKRLASGVTLNGAYTYSKLMGATSYLNPFDAMPEEVIAAEDRPHRFVMSGVWELPFGRGRQLFAESPAVVNKLISGWQLQGIFELQSGPALGFGNAIFNGNLADIVLPSSERSVNRWFNTDAGFERASNRQLANNVRRFSSRFGGIRGDMVNNADISLIKNTMLAETLRLQFRVEAFNAFNHSQLAVPNTTPSSSSFGRITAPSHLPRVTQMALKLYF